MSVDENRNPPPQPGPRIIVAIDGPAGAGKSTIARQLARHFGLLNLETGAMYRAFALKALRAGLALDESSGLEALAAETSIRLEPGEEENRVLLDGEDVTGLIRNPISHRSRIARKRLPQDSRLDGRPAAATGRSRRRGDGRPRHRDRGFPACRGQNLPGCSARSAWPAPLRSNGLVDRKGAAPPPPPDEIIRDLRARDERDRNRADSPLKPAQDSVILDSTNLTLDQAVSEAVNIVAGKLRSAGLSS